MVPERGELTGARRESQELARAGREKVKAKKWET